MMMQRTYVSPRITVGITDRQVEVFGHLGGYFSVERFGQIAGRFSARVESGGVVFYDGANHEIFRSPLIILRAGENSFFSIHQVTIGNRFHWERKEDQTFQGDLILRLREDGTICVMNEIPIEDYLISVISSEMNPAAPIEFLKAHAILSRSWVLAALDRKKKLKEIASSTARSPEGEIIRWYDRTDHDLFDVCADDHCQRYQGIKKAVSGRAEEAVRQTHGVVMTYQEEICDARYSKACGGMTENFNTAWGDQPVPYLVSISDSPLIHRPISTEEEARAWIFSEPNAYCNIKDKDLLERILPDVDRETENHFRWRVEYTRTELKEILRKKSGIDFGTLKEIIPLQRGPSGRIFRLKIAGSKGSVIVGKELEIRRWLSRTHLYSSAFVVTVEGNNFILNGAGWGHGVGLCQIGAGVMATRGFSAEEILRHYFRGVNVKKIYEEFNELRKL